MQMEQWMDVKGYEGAYQVSNLGRVKSLARKVLTKDDKWRVVTERILKPQKTQSGHLSVVLYQEGEPTAYSLARTVLATFTGIDPVDTHYASYRDSNHGNCRLENLYWQTVSDRNLQKNEDGTMPKGCMNNHPKSKLTEAQVLLIKSKPLKHGEAKFIANLLGVSHVCVSKVLAGQTWKDIPSYELKF